MTPPISALVLTLLFLQKCSALTQQPKNRRDFIVESVASASFPFLPKGAGAIQPSRPISLPPIGLGAWAWGDSLFWGYDKKNDNDLKEVFQYALEKKLAFFDTAELYGLGRSEELLGKFRAELCDTPEDREQVLFASKFAALPWRTTPSDVVKACKASVNRLGGNPIDLYQIHFPNSWSNEQYWDGIAECYEQGLVKHVGVSNYGVDALKTCHAHLAKRGIKLASNQIQMSLLYRWPLENGLIDACNDLDVKVLSYSPLALGFLTGKYSESLLPEGPRSKIGQQLFQDSAYKELLALMQDIGEKYGAVPLSQVSLNWCIAKGTIPIPGARSIRQAKQNLSTLDWSLTTEEVRRLDDASMKVKGFLTPDERPFPRKDVNTGLIMFDS
jgi:pyridoxine 4-dehydrogenase